MGNIIVKFIKRPYSKDDDIRNLFAYVAGMGENTEREDAATGCKGLSRNYQKAAEQVIFSQRVLGKDKGRRILHIVISFKYNLSLAFVKDYAEKAADYIFEEYPVYYGIHTSTDNVHIHMAVNRVSFNTNKKMHFNINELKSFRKELISVMTDKKFKKRKRTSKS